MRAFLSGLLAFSIWLPTAASAAGLFNPTVQTLDNGMQVVVIEDHRAPVVTHMVWFRAGSADEPPGKSGIAHFLEHLVFKGTEKVPKGEFSKIIARNGGRENAFTSYDFTGYYQNLASDRLELVMELFADRMENLILTENDVVTERKVILEERNSRTDNDPAAQFGEQMAAALFLASPYRRPVIGWKHEMEALSRQDALAWYKAYYAPNNAILVVAGDIQPAQVMALAKKYYGALKPRPVPARVRTVEPPHRAARRLSFEDPRVRQPSFQRNYLAPSRIAGEVKHAMALSVLADILGGGSTSRLHRQLVVDQKIAAGAGAFYSGLSFGRTRFGVYATPSPGGDVKALEAATDKVIDELLANGATEEEVARSKFGMKSGAIYARDNMFSGARIFGRALTVGLTVGDVENWPERVDKVTVEDVNQAAKYVFNLRRSVTGFLLPAKTKE